MSQDKIVGGVLIRSFGPVLIKVRSKMEEGFIDTYSRCAVLL